MLPSGQIRVLCFRQPRDIGEAVSSSHIASHYEARDSDFGPLALVAWATRPHCILYIVTCGDVFLLPVRRLCRANLRSCSSSSFRLVSLCCSFAFLIWAVSLNFPVCIISVYLCILNQFLLLRREATTRSIWSLSLVTKGKLACRAQSLWAEHIVECGVQGLVAFGRGGFRGLGWPSVLGVWMVEWDCCSLADFQKHGCWCEAAFNLVLVLSYVHLGMWPENNSSFFCNLENWNF